MNYPRVIGTYYRVLGWLCLASVLTAFWTDYLYLDLTFIVWLWLGSDLRKAIPAARKWAIGISLVATVAMAVMLATGAGVARFGSVEFRAPSIGYYAIAIVLFCLMGLPGLLLLSPSAKRQFHSNIGQSARHLVLKSRAQLHENGEN